MENRVIYVVDDEQKIRDLIRSYLIKEGYEVEVFPEGKSAYDAFTVKVPDMMVIDIMMPEMDGYSLCREIRKTSDIPIIMVSAKDEEIDRILGLELGSDDYISKPFSPRELTARIKTVFRRIRTAPDVIQAPVKQFKCNDVIIFLEERKVLVDKTEAELTTKEFELLLYLVENKNRVFTREQLISSIWGYDYIGDTRAVDDLVKRIRKKLGKAGSSLEITTVWGYGYKISGQGG
jgi:DNA-binding response OmpR family regulator